MYTSLALSVAFAATALAHQFCPGNVTLLNPSFASDVSGWVSTGSGPVTFTSEGGRGVVVISPGGVWGIRQQGSESAVKGSISLGAIIAFDPSVSRSDIETCRIELASFHGHVRTILKPHGDNPYSPVKYTRKAHEKFGAMSLGIHCTPSATVKLYISHVFYNVDDCEQPPSSPSPESISATTEMTMKPSATLSLSDNKHNSRFSNSSTIAKPTETRTDLNSRPTETSSGDSTPENPSCPRFHGRSHISRRKRHYRIKCGRNQRNNEVSKRKIEVRQESTASKFNECIDACDAVTGCQSALFNPVNLACNILTCVVADLSADLWAADLISTPEGPVETTTCPVDLLSTGNTATNTNIISTTSTTTTTSTSIFVENWIYNTMLITIVCCGCTGKCGVQVAVCSVCVSSPHLLLYKITHTNRISDSLHKLWYC